MAGYAYGTPLNSNAFAVARAGKSGSLDTGFGVGGRVVVDIGSSDDASTDVDVGADEQSVMGRLHEQLGAIQPVVTSDGSACRPRIAHWIPALMMMASSSRDLTAFEQDMNTATA